MGWKCCNEVLQLILWLMFYAILAGEKIEAIPHKRAKCPLCGEEVLSKCGEVKMWHWAHKNRYKL